MDFIQFIPTIISGVIALISMIFAICKKVKVYLKDTPFEIVLEQLPQLISAVEYKQVSGSDKKVSVLASAVNLLAKLSGEDTAYIGDIYGKRLSDAIEEILNAPQKKEVHLFHEK